MARQPRRSICDPLFGLIGVLCVLGCGGRSEGDQGEAEQSGQAGTQGKPSDPGTGGLAIDFPSEDSVGPECDSDDECEVPRDCCYCHATPIGAAPTCSITCDDDACIRQGVPAKAACRARRCVLAQDCDAANVTCDIERLPCKTGPVRSVVNGCWGPCISADECLAVTSCEDCTPDTVCVDQQLPRHVISCVRVAPTCREAPTCSCTDACPTSCSETSSGINCY